MTGQGEHQPLPPPGACSVGFASAFVGSRGQRSSLIARREVPRDPHRPPGSIHGTSTDAFAGGSVARLVSGARFATPTTGYLIVRQRRDGLGNNRPTWQ